MRLLYVCSDFGIPPAGTKGASIHLRAITRALAEAGHEILLLSPKEGPGADHPARRLLPPGCPPAEQSAKMLKRWMTQRGLDETLARELRPLLYNAWVDEPARNALADCPPDAILERLSPFGHVGIDLAESLGVPLVVEVNALLVEESRAFRSLELEDLAGLIERRTLVRADAIIVVSAALGERVAALGVPREKIHVIPNGADLAAFEATPPRDVCRAELGLSDELVVGFAGSLKVWHGVDDLLAAFQRLLADNPAARLLIVGTGPSEEGLRKSAARMGIEQSVTFTGAVEHERVPRLLRALDIGVAPFKPVENFYFSPIKLFEYMAAELCIVASHLGQIQDVIQHGDNGLLCNPDDVEDLAATLIAVSRLPEERRRLGRAALKTVKQRFTWAHTADSTVDVVRAAVEQHLGAQPSSEIAAPPEPTLEVSP